MGGLTPVIDMLTLDKDEIEQLTRYTQPSKQLADLHRQGFARARIARDGSVLLERAHYEAVCAGRVEAARPKLRLREKV